ncbi:MAG TPA: HepT-like ribonuclease domain-containing protein [Candidatus Limnocylindrales bacterium]|nr:HepT-like ribonuclease domain-containing protein [Candidatus Limnocylindrales bacterium]
MLRAVEIIGEASKNIPAAVKTKYSEIPWKDIAGMRDKVIHVYFGVDLKRVWRTVTEDIPNLRSNFEKILKDNKS